MSSVYQQPPYTSDADEEIAEKGIDVFAVLAALLREWRLGVIVFLVVTALCFAFIYTLKPQYEADVTILPQGARTEGGSLASLFLSRGPGALYLGLLRSRSVRDNVIDEAHLFDLLHTHDYEVARAILAGKSSFSETPDTIITITVRDVNAANAAMIANAYLVALQSLNQTMGMEQTRQTRAFFERQLADEKQELSHAEEVLAATQKRTGIIQPESQTSSGLSTIASVRGQITSLQVQLSALLQGATEQNPEVQRLRSEIGQLQAQERVLESSGSTPLGAAPAAGNIPQASLDFERAQREVTYHQQVVTSLTTQYQSARLSEDFNQPAFQIIDRAYAPENKSWPPRKPYMLISLAFALFSALAAVVIRILLRRMLASPERRAGFLSLRSALGPR